MARVLYDGKRLIPAPLVSITKSYQKTGNGEIIGKLYNLTLTGTLVAYMGSPLSSGTFYTGSDYPADENVAADRRLGSIQRKQEAIRSLFSVEGKQLEIQSSISDTPVRCNPRILEINFPEGIWYEKCDYSIVLETDELSPMMEDSLTSYISDATEEWSIDTNEENAEYLGIPKVYSLSHTITANGKRVYDSTGALTKEPWLYAKDFCVARLGFSSSMVASSGVNNIAGYYQGLNHIRNENIGKQDGSYSVTETWVLASGTSTENFLVQVSDALDSPYKTVTIEGEITGYDQRDANLNLLTAKYQNAESKWVSVSGIAYIRAQQFSGLTNLNLAPLRLQKNMNPVQGTIGYTYEYDTRPMTLVPGVRSESINIQDNIGGELFASVFVLGRTPGPVLQPLDTKNANTRTLSIELVLEPITYTDRTFTTIQSLFNAKPTTNPVYSGDIYNIIQAANPLNNGFTEVYQDQPQESWDITNFRYSYATNWTYE
jgi:hypothetical protein